MKERSYDLMWKIGVRVREIVKQTPFLNPVEEIMRRVGPRLIPPPAKDTEVSLPFEMKMMIPAGLPNARSFAAGRYERDVARIFTNIISSCMNVAVVGAGIGYHALLASPLVKPHGHVHTFEPDLRNYTYLQRNIQLNGCQNITAVHKAVSNYSGSGVFHQDKYGVEGHLIQEPSVNSIPIQTVSLDDYFAELGWPKLDILMIDVEGAEEKVLIGMKKLSYKNPKLKLLLELHISFIKRDGGNVNTIPELLKELGFIKGYIINKELKACSFPTSLPAERNAYDLLLVKDN